MSLADVKAFTENIERHHADVDKTIDDVKRSLEAARAYNAGLIEAGVKLGFGHRIMKGMLPKIPRLVFDKPAADNGDPEPGTQPG